MCGVYCVKITPAHDPNDYQAGLRNNLEVVEVFDDSSIMGDLVPEYKGMPAIKARELIVKKLKELGNLVKIEDYTHSVGKCYRCHNTIEPRVSEQWFIKMKDLAKKAADAVRNDEVKFVPKRYEKMYYNWLDNIQDWCISRQLWWGHRIPVYYCDDCGHINVAKETPEKCEKCGSTHLHQDEDSLDTWFSSALWPFSTLGWPTEDAEDYKRYYPTNTLVTGYDIITFWISRMMTQGIELTGKNPFKDVLVHGIVRDSQGRKMSKSLGNGIDPIEIIDKYGADALRFSVLSGTTMGNDIKYMPEKLEQASNFANKIWNAAKFITMNMVSEEKIFEFGVKTVCKIYEKEAKTVEKLKEIIVGIRNIRAQMNIHPSKKAVLIFVTNDYENEIWEAKDFLLKLGFGEKIVIKKDKLGIKDDAISILADGIELYIPFEGLVNLEEERKRLQEEKTKLLSEVSRCEKMLANQGFINKAPQAKIQEEKDKLATYKEMLAKVEERLK